MRYARICPNTNGWTSPSGGKKWSNSSFPGKNGFGFDEWLLGTPTIQAGRFAGQKAGFIQGFKRFKVGIPEEVHCFWIDGAQPRQAHLAVVINNCQKLNHLDALAIQTEYTASGFIQRMTNSLNGLNPTLNPVFPVDPLEMFNVVFQYRDLLLINPPTPSPICHSRYSVLFR